MFLRDSNSKEESLKQGNNIKKFFKNIKRVVRRSRIREGFDSGPDDENNWYNNSVSPIEETVEGTPSGSIQNKTASFNEKLKQYAEKSKQYYAKQGSSTGKPKGLYKLNKLVNGNPVYYLVNNLGVVRKVPHYKDANTDATQFWNPTNASNNNTLSPHISCRITAGTNIITESELSNLTKGDDVGKYEPCYLDVDKVIIDNDNANSAYYITNTGKKRLLPEFSKLSDSCKTKKNSHTKENAKTIEKIPDGGAITKITQECRSGVTTNDLGAQIDQLNKELIDEIKSLKTAVDDTRKKTKKIEDKNVSARSTLNTSHTNLVAQKKKLNDLQGNTLALKRSFEDSVKDANVLKIHYALWFLAFILTIVLIYLDYDSTYVLIAAVAIIGISFVIFIVNLIKKAKKKLSEKLYKLKSDYDPTSSSTKKSNSDSGIRTTVNIMTNAS